MAERNRSGHPNPNAGGSNTAARPRGSASLSTVRRNLFQNTQNAKGARRPAPASSGSSEPLQFDADLPGSDSSEIVVRDSHGEIELGDPPTPDMEDREELPGDNRQESEQERQKLADAVKLHQINSSVVADQPEELIEAVKASLRTKVAALSEDNWMYEPDEPSRGA